MKDVNVPKGYKSTDIGVIPEDWEVKQLGDITDIKVGRDVRKNNFSTYKDNEYKYPVFSNTVDNKGLYGFYNIKEYYGDSLTVVGRGIGLGTAFTRHGGYGAIGRLLVLFPNKDVISSFLTNYINHKLDIFKESSGIPQLTGIQIAKYNIPLPPLPEQKAIARVLSDVDDLIRECDSLLAKKRDIKQGTMQLLLTGKKRLPGFSGEKKVYKQTEIGMIPIDWELYSLGEIANVKGGKRLPKGKSLSSKETKHPYIKVSDLFYGGVSLEAIEYVPDEVFSSIKNYRIYENDLFISVAGTLGIVGKIPAKLNGANLTENADRITNIKCERDFLLYVLLSSIIQDKIESVKTVGAQPKLAIERILKFHIPLPPTLPEQKAIAKILSDMDAEIEALEQKRDKYKAIKQGMMQELLTGKTRLIDN